MSVGNFGKVYFLISQKKAYSFSNFKHIRTAEWKEHVRYNNKPISEFTGSGLENITLDIYLDASLGVKPREEIERWGKLVDSGHHDILVIGGQQVGKYEWKIESVSEDWKNFLNQGELMTATISITLSEYVIESTKKKETTKATKTKTYLATPKVSVGSLVVGGTYKVNVLLTGYYTSMEAKNLQATNRTGKVYPGTYNIFNLANGMVNVTKVKGSPGSWINPSKNK
ncbi:MAG: phage tail protein [Anaerocolumna sp.]